MKPIWLEIAERELGVHEVAGDGSCPRVLEYAACTSLHADSDDVPWCSSFMNWVMKQAGMARTNSAAARSWLDYGAPLAKPVEGCIVILKRGAPPSGHVGLFIEQIGDRIKVLGGNQSDGVRYSTFPVIDVLGYRWPVSAGEA